MIPEAQRLHAALVSAFPAYALGRFSDRGYPLGRATVEAIEAATAQLDLDLAAELEQPFVEQRRTPLEVFASALNTLTPILASLEIEQPPDTGDGDRYALAPGSSAALGDAVQAASLAWGAAKAAALTGGDPRGPHRPSVVVMTTDRGAREELCHAAVEAGYDCVAARNPSAVAEAIASNSLELALVDLAHRAAYDAVERLGKAGVTTIVFGAGVDDLTETGLRAAGVRVVIERDQLLSAPAEHFPQIA